MVVASQIWNSVILNSLAKVWEDKSSDLLIENFENPNADSFTWFADNLLIKMSASPAISWETKSTDVTRHKVNGLWRPFKRMRNKPPGVFHQTF
jgi:hypothetical protein